MNPYNPKDIIKYLDETASQEEKDFINSPEGKKKYEEFKKMNLPPAINLDGSPRKKNDLYDYGLNEYDAECEYHAWLWELKNA